MTATALSTSTLLVVIGITTFASLIQALTGFGFALLAVPLLSLTLAPKTAVVLVFLLGSLSSILTALLNRGAVNWVEVRRLSVGSFLAMPFGVVLLIGASVTLLRVILGVATCAAAFWLMFGQNASQSWAKRPSAPYVMGAVSGILNTSLSTNGPPIVAYLRARGLGVDSFRSTISTFFVLSSVVGLAMLFVGGAVHHQSLMLFAWSVGFCFIGWAVGQFSASRINPAHFTKAVDGLMLLSGLLTLSKVVLG